MKNSSVIPELCVHDARSAIDFYKKAFRAKDLGTHATPDGKKIMHCGLELNGGVIFVRDDFPEASGGRPRNARALGGSPVTIHLNCMDVRKTWKAALAAGASVVMPLAKQFWGDTYGIVEDPYGQRWSMSAAHGSEKRDTDGSDYTSGAEQMYPTGKARAKPRAKASKRKPKR